MDNHYSTLKNNPSFNFKLAVATLKRRLHVGKQKKVKFLEDFLDHASPSLLFLRGQNLSELELLLDKLKLSRKISKSAWETTCSVDFIAKNLAMIASSFSIDADIVNPFLL